MKRFVPHPMLSVALVLTWLALNNTVDPGQVLLGLLLGLAIPPVLSPFLPEGVRLGRPWTALRLLLRVLGDIVVANIEVARRILGPEAAISPRFVWVPLDTDNPWVISTLAAIVTLTPGTLSSDLSADRRHLLVHAFNVSDEARLIRTIKSRYEAPLKEIFH